MQVEGYSKHNRAAGEPALDLIASGKVRMAPPLSARLPFGRYAGGVDLQLRCKTLKILYIPGEEA